MSQGLQSEQQCGRWLLGGEREGPHKGAIHSQPGGLQMCCSFTFPRQNVCCKQTPRLGKGVEWGGGKNNKAAKTHPATKLKLSLLQSEELLGVPKGTADRQAAAHRGNRTAHWKPKGGTAVLQCSEPAASPPPHLQTSLCKTASIMPCLLRKQLVKPAESQNCLAWKGT